MKIKYHKNVDNVYYTVKRKALLNYVAKRKIITNIFSLEIMNFCHNAAELIQPIIFVAARDRKD